jgi:hypothetical protein
MFHACLRALRGLGAAALAAPLLAVPAATGQAVATAGPAGAAGPDAATVSSGPATQVLLITGDRLLVPPGLPNTAVIQPSSARRHFVFLSGCSQGLKIPVEALPFLGRGLDPSLFRLADLERAEGGGRLPVRLSYLGARPAVPGVTVTRTGRGVAQGYLTAASARAFGAALRRQFAADHRTGGYGTDGLFAHGLSIALPGAPAPPAQPQFPMQTLTVTGSNLAGNPDTGDTLLVFNLDNCNKLDLNSSVNSFFHGAAKFSVPAGHYWAAVLFFSRLVILPQFTVEHDTTVHASERAPSSTVTVKTPRPGSLSPGFTLLRSNHGRTEGLEWVNWRDPQPLRVSLVRHRPSIGQLQAYTDAAVFSPGSLGGPGPAYVYGLDFPAPPGIIPPLHYTARPAGLVTVQEHYYKDTKVSATSPPGFGNSETVGGFPPEIAAGLGPNTGLDTRMPGSGIEYLSAQPTIWRTFFDPFAFFTSQLGPLRSYRAGPVREDWGRYPLHPTPNASLPGAGLFPVMPSASRDGNTLSLDITPFGDNQLGDIGSGYGGGSCRDFRFSCQGTYALYQNGTLIAQGDAAKQGFPDLLVHAKLSPKPSLIKVVLTADRSGHEAYLLSAASKDVWTWRSRPEPKATVPAPWHCHETGRLLGPPSFHGRHCAVQDMTTLRYQVAGLSLRGLARPGRQQIAITASPIQLAPATPLTHASVQVSFDSGKTWHPATVTKLSAGKFRAVFTAPAHTKVTLRTHVAGAAGVSVTETINGAYQIAKS